MTEPNGSHSVSNNGVGHFIGRLIEPPAHTPAPLRSRLRLLSGLLLALLTISLLAGVGLTIFAATGTLANITSVYTAWGAVALVGLAYWLARRGRYLPAAGLTVAVTLLGILPPLLADPNVIALDRLPLAYLAIPVILAGLLLAARPTLIIAFISLGLALYLHSVGTNRGPLGLLDLVVYIGAVSLLVAVGTAIRHRDAARLAAQSRQLAESTSRFTTAFDLAADGMALMSLDGRWVLVNRALGEMFGYDEAALLATSIADLTVPEDRDNDADLRAALLRGERASYQVERRCLHRGGRQIWIQLSVALVRDEDEAPAHFIAQFHDISLRKAAALELEESNARLTVWLAEAEQRTRDIVLLNEMGELLQACTSAPEAHRVVGDMAPLLFPGSTGALCTQNPSRTIVETVAAWGPGEAGTRVFAPDDCWALRRGRLHISPPAAPARRCRHLSDEPGRAHACLPLAAQGEPLGLLHLSLESEDLKDTQRRLLHTVADNIALALANLRLRDTLRSQSIRDPLTGLYNRRYLEETLEREVRRAARAGRALGVIMFDIDHFKQFNDAFGHNAGDAVLRALGAYLQQHVRGGDIACRLGGEEFLLILPEAGLAVVEERAALVQGGARELAVEFGGQALGAITLSAGVSVFPEHGGSAETLIEAADTAMYRAKRAGRDRVVTFA
jgi:diguanylate cyclase (GGDEF)-like protein/PAS domain S-box-containing protein